MAKKNRLFNLTFRVTPEESPISWVFQWRYVHERDRRHKLTLSKKQRTVLRTVSEKKDLIIADFLYHYYTGYDGSSGTREVVKMESRYSLLIADFDQLPAGFFSFVDFEQHLISTYPTAVVLRTPSDKAKLLFLVEQDVAGDRTYNGLRWKALSLLLNDARLTAAADPRTVSNHKCFFSIEMIESFNRQKDQLQLAGSVSSLAEAFENSAKADRQPGGTPELDPLTRFLIAEEEEVDQATEESTVCHGGLLEVELAVPSVPSANSPAASLAAPVTAKILALCGRRLLGRDLSAAGLNSVNDRISDLTGGKKIRPKYRKLLLYIACQPYANSCIHLSQKRLSKKLKVSVGLVNRYLHKALSEGFLEIVSMRYVPGDRSRSYKLSDQGLLQCHERLYKYNMPPPASSLVIEDGEWNRALFSLTRYFDSFDSYIEFIKSLRGVTEKTERLTQAKNAWKSHSRRLGEATASPL